MWIVYNKHVKESAIASIHRVQSLILRLLPIGGFAKLNYIWLGQPNICKKRLLCTQLNMLNRIQFCVLAWNRHSDFFFKILRLCGLSAVVARVWQRYTVYVHEIVAKTFIHKIVAYNMDFEYCWINVCLTYTKSNFNGIFLQRPRHCKV